MPLKILLVSSVRAALRFFVARAGITFNQAANQRNASDSPQGSSQCQFSWHRKKAIAANVEGCRRRRWLSPTQHHLSLWTPSWAVVVCCEFSCHSIESFVRRRIGWKFGFVAQWEELRHCRQSMGCSGFWRDREGTDRKAHWWSHRESLAVHRRRQ